MKAGVGTDAEFVNEFGSVCKKKKNLKVNVGVSKMMVSGRNVNADCA